MRDAELINLRVCASLDRGIERLFRIQSMVANTIFRRLLISDFDA